MTVTSHSPEDMQKHQHPQSPTLMKQTVQISEELHLILFNKHIKKLSLQCTNV